MGEIMKYSVIMRVHIANEYLKKAIKTTENAINESEGELIVVINGSEKDYIYNYIKNTKINNNTKIIISNLKSISYCLNRGVDEAAGEYIAIMDSDDECLRDRFINQYELAKNNKIDILCSAVDLIDHDGKIIGKKTPNLINLYKENKIINPAIFIKKELIIGYGGYFNFSSSEDYQLILKSLNDEKKIFVDNTSRVRYRVYEGQTTSAKELNKVFKNNIGIKLITGMELSNYRILFSSLWDVFYLVIRLLKNAYK